jgi:membrane protein
MNFIRALYRNSRDDSLLRHSAAVAYYAAFSLPALMLVVFSIVRTTLRRPSVEAEILEPVRLYMGEGTAQLLRDAAQAVQEQSTQSSWPVTVGVLILVLAAIGLIRELQSSLNSILGLPPDKSTLATTLIRYLKAIIPLVLIGFILATSIAGSTFLAIAEQRIVALLNLPVDLLQFSSYLVIIIALTSIFSVLYAVLPSKRYPIKRIVLCAFGASLCLFFGSILVSAATVFASIGSMYGVAAGLLVLLFWMFFCANVFFVGAECIDLLSHVNQSAGSSK